MADSCLIELLTVLTVISIASSVVCGFAFLPPASLWDVRSQQQCPSSVSFFGSISSNSACRIQSLPSSISLCASFDANTVDSSGGGGSSSSGGGGGGGSSENLKNNLDQEEEEDMDNSSSPDTDDAVVTTIEPIGRISSVYKLCVGTPRQGLLAPNSRGRIDLYTPQLLSEECIDGLTQYSHIWIVFIFHLNSNNKKPQQGQRRRQFTSKISPPSYAYQQRQQQQQKEGSKKKSNKNDKIGILATRSPHRPNPIGFTLCRLDSVRVWESTRTTTRNNNKKKQKTQPKKQVSLYISGLDLVDGTPVVDIKPFVPQYDSVMPTTTIDYSPLPVIINSPQHDENFFQGGQEEQQQQSSQEEDQSSPIQSSTGSRESITNTTTRVPEWVSMGLNRRRKVQFTSTALQQLQAIMATTPKSQLEFYGGANSKYYNYNHHHHQKDKDEDHSSDSEYIAIRDCIVEVLSVDVRSSYQNKKAKRGKSRAENSQRIQQHINNIQQKQDQGIVNQQPPPGEVKQQKENNRNKEQRGLLFKNDNDNDIATVNVDLADDGTTYQFSTQQLDNLLIYFTLHEDKDEQQVIDKDNVIIIVRKVELI